MSFLKRLRRINVRRCREAFRHGLMQWSIMEWGCAIGGEAGELQNVLKKIRRAELGLAGSRVLRPKRDAANEMADVIIYIDLLAARMGIDLEAAIADKFNETSRVMQFKQRLLVGRR